MISTRRFPGRWPGRARRPRRRAGVTVVVVLALISIALAMSYAILRSQMTGIHLQANVDRTAQARQAALAGLSAALRTMRLSTWAGVGTNMTATINPTDSYNVTFTAGDASLTVEAANYAELPYRVTVDSTGTSLDPAQPGVATTYKVRAVMKLIPRQLSTAPSNWSTLLSYTLYQLNNTSAYLALPCHIEGPVRLQSGINVGDPYGWNSGPRNRYFSDLNLMRSGANEVQTVTRNNASGGSFTLSFDGATTGSIAWNASSGTMQTALQSLSTIGAGNVSVSGGGSSWTVSFVGQLAATNVPAMTDNDNNLWGYGASINVTTTSPGIPGTPDYRQFSGPIWTPTSLSTSTNLGLLTSQLAVTVNNISVSSQSAPTLGPVTTYRLYPGGPLYNIAQLPASPSNATLAADPATNPLGLFYNSSNATLGSNVTITGTVITGVDLNITGTNVSILPFNLPPVEGSTVPVRLPAVVALDDLRVYGGASATISGVTYIAGDLDVPQGAESTALSITGNVILGQDLIIERRTEWKNYSNSQWEGFHASFLAQVSSPSGNPFFPQWLAANQGRNYVALINVQPETTPVVFQWQNFSNPLYVVKAGDSGLHWDLVSWTDRP
jgi:hypothetical protein